MLSIAIYTLITVAALAVIDHIVQWIRIMIPKALMVIVICGTLALVIHFSYHDFKPSTNFPRTNIGPIEIPQAVSEVHESENTDLVNIKKGVNASKLNPKIDAAIKPIARIYRNIVGRSYVPTITSANDYSGHTSGSAHYKGAALDFRLNDIKSERKRSMVVSAVQKSLGPEFYVIREGKGTLNDHMHVQLKRF